VRNIARDVLRPFFDRVETDDADWVVILPLKHVHNDRFEVSSLSISFAVGTTLATKVVEDDVDVLIVAIWHDRWRPIPFTHRNSPQQNCELNKMWHIPFLRSLGEF
jgi:hypothetical protein